MNKVTLSLAFLSLSFSALATADQLDEKKWAELYRKKIEDAVCIAVVDFQRVAVVDDQNAELEFYSHVADAVILKCLKGKQMGKIKTYGGRPRDFINFPSGYREGKFLIFLGKDEHGQLNTAIETDLLSIKDNQLRWGKKVTDLKVVEEEIKNVLKPPFRFEGLAEGDAAVNAHAKAFENRLERCSHALLVCTYKDYMKDDPENELHQRHYREATIVRVFKGDSKVSRRLNFFSMIEGEPEMKLRPPGELSFVFFDEMPDGEVLLGSGNEFAFNEILLKLAEAKK